MQNECFFLLKSLISMCKRGLNKGRNLHVKLLLFCCCPFQDTHDYLKRKIKPATNQPNNQNQQKWNTTKSSFTSTSKFSARNQSHCTLYNSIKPTDTSILISVLQNYPHLLRWDRGFIWEVCFSTLNHTFDWILTKIKQIRMSVINHLIPWEESLANLTSLSLWFYYYLMLLWISILLDFIFPVSLFSLFLLLPLHCCECQNMSYLFFAPF